jgi:hypothetical protein
MQDETLAADGKYIPAAIPPDAEKSGKGALHFPFADLDRCRLGLGRRGIFTAGEE